MLLTVENVTFSYTGEPVLKDVSLAVNEGERIGFIGGNGEGKTTLLKLMLGTLAPEAGSVIKKNGIRIGYLEQSGGFESGDTVYRAAEEVFARDKELIKELARVQSMMAADGADLAEYARKQDALEKEIAARDSYRYEVKIATVLNGMGFGNRLQQSVSSLSGGEKTKLRLCRLLLEAPDLLILDEPTNHLDTATLFWLEDYLTEYKGALLIVSHDRYFLDRLTAKTWEIERGKLVSYKGNYSKYKILKAERVKEQQREYEKQLEPVAKLQNYIDRNLVRATTAKSAQSRVKQLDKLELTEKPLPPPAPPRFAFTYETGPYEKVISTEKFDLRAGDNILLNNTEFTLMRGDKCALVGANGTGKSTLLKFLLSGDRRVKFAKFVKAGYYDQENADLNPADTVLDALRFRFPLFPLTEAYGLLAKSGIDKDDALKRVGELSGGLKAKLELAILQATHANLLVLDEPTNHLDLPSREALEEALCAFDGTLLFVSHDRRFIESVATSVISIENGTLTRFEGNYRDYVAQKRAPATLTQPPKERKTQEDTGYRSKEERAREAQKRNRTKEIENRLEAIEAKENELNERLALCAADYAKVKEITERLEALRNESDALYEEYAGLIE